jgi:hypothetical protein
MDRKQMIAGLDSEEPSGFYLARAWSGPVTTTIQILDKEVNGFWCRIVVARDHLRAFLAKTTSVVPLDEEDLSDLVSDLLAELERNG